MNCELQRSYRSRSHLWARPGFSLVEIVAVVVIIGILAAGAAVAILPQVEKARVNTTKNSMRTVKSAISTYMVEKSQAPASLSALVPDFLELGSTVDAWKTPYYFAVTPGGAHPYQLISAGKDQDLTTVSDNIDLWTMELTE